MSIRTSRPISIRSSHQLRASFSLSPMVCSVLAKTTGDRVARDLGQVLSHAEQISLRCICLRGIIEPALGYCVALPDQIRLSRVEKVGLIESAIARAQ